MHNLLFSQGQLHYLALHALWDLLDLHHIFNEEKQPMSILQKSNFFGFFIFQDIEKVAQVKISDAEKGKFEVINYYK